MYNDKTSDVWASLWWMNLKQRPDLMEHHIAQVFPILNGIVPLWVVTKHLVISKEKFAFAQRMAEILNN